MYQEQGEIERQILIDNNNKEETTEDEINRIEHESNIPESPATSRGKKSSISILQIVGAIIVLALCLTILVVTLSGNKNDNNNNQNSHPKNHTPSDSNATNPNTTLAVQEAMIRWIGSDIVEKYFDVGVFLENSSEYQQLKIDAGILTSESSSSSFSQVAPKGNDAFSIEVTDDNYIKIRSTTPSALGTGFYYVAKNFFGAQVTWGVNGTGDQTASLLQKSDAEIKEIITSKIRPALPPPKNNSNKNSKLVIVSSTPIRYAWNMCTFGYSSTFWDWKRWQRELDWFLFHGINFPLALLGQEYVWLKTLESFGLNFERDFQSWFAGPAFLPWNRAGNMREFGGPLPLSSIIQQYQLQKKILAVMRSLQMTPVLPCFGGHVPQSIKKVFPNISLTESPQQWNSFPRVWLVDPLDPAFVAIGERFMQKLQEVYGFDSDDVNYFSCDEYNENDPSNSTSSYLNASSAAVVEYISRANPKGVWVLQAWLFGFAFWQVPGRVKAYVGNVPKNRLLILDLHSEDGVIAFRFDSYYDHAFVWCLLHNYGGRRGIYGNLSLIGSAPFQALPSSYKSSSMIGMGFTPESIEQNPVVYELMTENFFSIAASSISSINTEYFDFDYVTSMTQHFNIEKWLDRYLGQRYFALLEKNSSSSSAKSKSNAPYLISQISPNIWSAWKLLLSTLYNQPNDPVSDLERVPMINLYYWTLQNSQNGDGTLVLDAWKLFYNELLLLSNDNNNNNDKNIFNAQNQLSSVSGPIFYDLTDIGRMAAIMYFGSLHAAYLNVAWFNQDPSSFLTQQFNTVSNEMLDIILAVDDLYSFNPNYLFGHWLQSALDNAPDQNNQSIRELWFYNAKNQVTLWGPIGNINDYAQKPWQGLYKNYYHLRWKTANEFIISSQGGMFTDQSAFAIVNSDVEVSWCNNFTEKNQMDYNSKDYLRSSNGYTSIQEFNDTMNKIKNLIDDVDDRLGNYFRVVKANTEQISVQPLNYFASPWISGAAQLAKLCFSMSNVTCAGFTPNSSSYGGLGVLYSYVSMSGGSSFSEDVYFWK
jgi:alpha-N-acetylglucosaminidase